MFLKERFESEEYRILRALNVRGELSEDDKTRLERIKKGFEGELQFDQHVSRLKEERLVLNDLLFELGGSYFQIDSLIISAGVIDTFNVKNFEGDYMIKDGKFCNAITGAVYANPIEQSHREYALLKQLLEKNKLKFLVKSSVVFIHPKFTLYQAPLDENIIYPGQVERFIEKENMKTSKLYDRQKKAAELLLSLQQTKNPHIVYPDYDYKTLKKLIYCKSCNSTDVEIIDGELFCNHCEAYEKLNDAVLRMVQEFKLLFPERKVTTSVIYEWCGIVGCRKRIQRLLKANLVAKGKTADRYYE